MNGVIAFGAASGAMSPLWVEFPLAQCEPYYVLVVGEGEVSGNSAVRMYPTGFELHMSVATDRWKWVAYRGEFPPVEVLR